ncbi:aromatic amino acid lyase [Kineococcus sp. R8]|nr:aromatic amino acid lyase [Kineococcus siccus]
MRVLADAAELDADLVLAVADRRCTLALGAGLRARLAGRRAELLAALAAGGPVYGVSTGMGALAGVPLDAAAQARHQDALVVGRAVGSAPWLTRPETRALLAVRLRTLLHPEAGASPALADRLVALLAADVLPAVPARGTGVAGEIVPLAHAGAVVLGAGRVLAAGRPAPDGSTDGTADGAAALAAAGLGPAGFGPKEGVAFLEGVPAATALALLRVREARRLLAQVPVVLAVSAAVVGASHDPVHPALARADAELGAVLARLRALRPDGPVRGLQAPVSFRVTPAALVVAGRACSALEQAAQRALDGVTDSPALLDGAFVGTAGFAGTELTAGLDALAARLVHVADTGAARLHRLLDARLTGLPAQLSPEPGVHAGLVAVHKRAVGTVHRLRRFATPSLLGPVETSLGQEDVQSFAFEAAECVAEALTGLREVLAAELLAGHRARALAGGPPGLSGEALAALAALDAVLPAGTADRPYGRDLDVLVALLRAGWAL